ncbi:MAG: ABC transporter ATP-binding protein [Deltaproteobacteria bacterium]|nr:ABC transporter ATP-binding protein [Deltaproteobacteria bacterium]
MKLEATALHAALRARPVLRGVEFEARPGEVTAVIGPNGAGKSTLLRVLCGLLPPTGGRVLLDSLPLAHWSRTELARRLAYVPQDRTVHWALTVRNVIALGRLPFQIAGGAQSADDDAAVEAALADMDVTTLQERPVTEISGGELARVLVARALAQRPAVLVADEPAAGLDPAHQLSLFAHFRRIAEKGCNVIVALHDLSLAARFCHKVVLLRAGAVIATGEPEKVLTSEHLASAYGVDARLRMLDGIPVVQVLGELP